MFPSVNEQMDVIKRGTEEIIPEDELVKKIENSIETNEPLIIKEGFDPTAPDLHIGHMVTIRKLKQFQELGHTVIFLIGDFTGLVGDPSGRLETRKMMTPEDVERNAETYKEQIFKVLDPKKTIIRFNSDWLGKLSVYDFMELSSRYTVARMLERDDFKKRFDNNQDISILEFLYCLLQGYDSVALKSDVELGGTDQKFNLLAARNIQRRYDVEPQVIITMPLLVGTDGVEKMSKSLNNHVGITEVPFEIFGKIMKISDPLMLRYYELLTDEPLSQIEKWKKEIKENKINPRDLKARLAGSIVSDFWEKKEAKKAAQEFDRVFKHKEVPSEIEDIEIKELKGRITAKSEVKAKLQVTPLIDLLVDKNILPSRGEAKRMIRQGGVYLDGERIEDIGFEIDLSKKKEQILKIGKRKFFRLKS